jgi:hypothetical protein
MSSVKNLGLKDIGKLIRLAHITKLGRPGEILAVKRLKHERFTDIENLNLRRNTHPFGLLVGAADRAGACPSV